MKLDYHALAFWLFAATAVLPAFLVLVTRDIVRMAFWLLVSFGGVAGLYFSLGADFLGITQIMVYIGGILILILFGVMLTRKAEDFDGAAAPREPDATRGPGLVVQGLSCALLLAALTGHAIQSTPWAVQAPAEPGYTARGIGELLMTDYILPFEIASVVLLVALVGAAYVVRREKEQG